MPVMASAPTWMRRAFFATPFLLLAGWCFDTMNLERLKTEVQPYVDSGFIEWDGNRVKMLDHFHGVDLLDHVLRGAMVTFSVSTFGYDGVASWQMFSFLVDLGPLITIWILESTRGAHAWTPAYIPSIFILAAQFLGIGTVAPVFYFLSLTFGPTASELATTSRTLRTIWHRHNRLLVPIVLVLHTSVVFAMFLAPNLDSRHYWTWAWQLVPLWIGLCNFVAAQTIRSLRIPALPALKLTLSILGLVSLVVWMYTLLFSPHSVAKLFIPVAGQQYGLLAHARKALQADEMGAFLATYLWLVYSVADLYLAGIVGNMAIVYVVMAPFLAVAIGPGATFVLGWCLREKMIESYN